MNENVTPLRSSPPVSDIPGQLRQMADMIERGDIEASATLFIIPREAGEWPEIYGWGEHLGDYGNIAVCELAKSWFVNNRTAR